MSRQRTQARVSFPFHFGINCPSSIHRERVFKMEIVRRRLLKTSRLIEIRVQYGSVSHLEVVKGETDIMFRCIKSSRVSLPCVLAPLSGESR